MTWRLRQLKVLLAACAIAFLISVTGRGLAQIRQVEQGGRDNRRVERRVEDLQKAYDDLRLDIEKRLTKIEAYMNAGTWLLGAIITVLVGQLGAGLGKGVIGLLALRKAQIGKGEDL